MKLSQRFWTEVSPVAGIGIGIGGALGLGRGLTLGWWSTWGGFLGPRPLSGLIVGLFWGHRRPFAFEVEAALRAVASDSWTELLHHLDAIKGSRQGPTPWIAQLSGETWQERFLARHALAALGGAAVEPLRTHNSSAGRWLLKSIAAETARQLGSRAESLLCPRCFARCQQHRVQLRRGAITYYGCRLCRQSVEWLDAREVVAVLDNQMALAWRQRDGRLYVDGLTRRAPFDFDRVAIVYATDEAVERFCMQVGNDTDEVRRSRYRSMPYEVGCPLTENTRRILQHTFGGA